MDFWDARSGKHPFGPGFSYTSQTCSGSCSTWWSGMLGKQASAACSTFHTVKNNKKVLKEVQKLSDWNVICYGLRCFEKIMMIHVTSLWTRSTSIVCGPTSPTLFFFWQLEISCVSTWSLICNDLVVQSRSKSINFELPAPGSWIIIHCLIF
jgi:hypothetical protein